MTAPRASLARVTGRSPFEVACWVCFGLATVPAAAILLALPVMGLGSLIATPLTVGQDGLLAPAIGTGILMTAAALIAAPLALGAALAATAYGVPAWRRRLSSALFTLNGFPSILLGVLGFLLFTKLLGMGKSWLAGSLVLAVMILPAVTAAAVEAIRGIPREAWEAARGLGLTRAQALRAVVVPRAMHGLVAGLVLGLARAAGETAPIMFTAVVLSGAVWPDGIAHAPVQALPYAIWHSAQDTLDAASVARGWAAALLLTALSATLLLAVAPLRRRLQEEAA